MKFFSKNKKFICSFFIGFVISMLLLFSINIFLLQNNKKKVYDNSIISFDESDKNKFSSLNSSLFLTGPNHQLSLEEAKKEINYELFSKIMDITIKYNVNNVLDSSIYNDDTEIHKLSKQELEDAFLSDCSFINTDEYGKFFQMTDKNHFYIKFSYDGQIIDYIRYFNYNIREEISLNLSKENLASKLEIAKNFLDDYSMRII